jgi:methionyl-tRNA formyltransferase
VECLAGYAPDVFVVVAYGLILPQTILDTPRLGCLNVHASLLPRWRGAAPIERAIMAGDAETGVSIMGMEAGLDTGPVYTVRATPIHEHTTSPDLEDDLARLGAQALTETLTQFVECEKLGRELPQPTPQDASHATYAPKITRADRNIDWAVDASVISRRVAALAHRQAPRCNIDGVGLQLLDATAGTQALAQQGPPGTIVAISSDAVSVQCATNLLHIRQVRMETGKGAALSAGDAVNGYPQLFAIGRRLTTARS